MSEVQIFPSKEFGDIRTAVIKGKEYFCGNDVASALCYQVPKNAVSRHCKGALFWCPSDETQEMKYIPLGDVYRLIVKASSQSNSEDIKEKAGRFERLVFDEILPQIHRTGSYGTPQTLQQQIQVIAQGTDELYQRVDAVTEDVKSVRSEIESLKLDLPILPIEAETITNAVKSRGVKVMGGKDSNAYRDRSIVNTVYRDIYSQIYRNFGVRSYKAIKRSQTDKVIEVVNKYEPPVILEERIQNANAQQRLDV